MGSRGGRSEMQRANTTTPRTRAPLAYAARVRRKPGATRANQARRSLSTEAPVPRAAVDLEADGEELFRAP
eukprot:416204-Lingulodinium_polyedra.AAC.1